MRVCLVALIAVAFGAIACATGHKPKERSIDGDIIVANSMCGGYAVRAAPNDAVVVVDRNVVGRGRNARESRRDPTAHAEVLALQEAARSLQRWRLTGATVYATLEPCPMCAGALVNARVDRLVYAVPDPKAGAAGTLFDVPRDPRLNHRVEVTAGVLAAECGELLSTFFRTRRGK